MGQTDQTLPADDHALRARLDGFRADFDRLRLEIGKVIVGQDEIVRGVLTAMVGGGHVLLEGVPGLGKTLLVRTLADTLRLSFKRIQFTPDLMPADVVGTNIVTEAEGGGREFRFQPGPLFAHVVLADEINRATPKTQSALLEAMAEQSITVGGATHRLPAPFFVLATQNPLEMEGTYPLPEAQLDRFFFKLLVPFPTAAQVEAILERTTEGARPVAEPVMDGPRIRELAELVRQVPIAGELRRHAVALVMATHPEQPSAPKVVREMVKYGASPRGAQAIVLGAKLRAILEGRFHVGREDLDATALPALRHRIILGFQGLSKQVSADEVLAEIVRSLG